MKIPVFPGKYHQNGWFSMAMLVYRRVSWDPLRASCNFPASSSRSACRSTNSAISSHLSCKARRITQQKQSQPGLAKNKHHIFLVHHFFWPFFRFFFNRLGSFRFEAPPAWVHDPTPRVAFSFPRWLVANHWKTISLILLGRMNIGLFSGESLLLVLGRV